MRGDPIFIFFAGHGSELPAPRGWAAGGPDSKIQALVPQDYNSSASDPKKLVYAIPDRTVGALINKISREKGNNIVSANVNSDRFGLINYIDCYF